MTATWVDVTDLLQWPKRPTGIQRVVSEMVEGFHRAGLGVRLLYYGRRTGLLAELSYEGYRRHVELLTLGNARSAQLRRWSLSRAVYAPPRPAKLHRGDTVLVLGGYWTRRELLRTLRKRQGEGFLVHHFVHDVLPLTDPQFFPPEESIRFARYMREAFALSTSVITSTRANAEEVDRLTRRGQLPSVPVHVVPLGDSDLLRVNPLAPPLSLPASGYLLVVGTLEIRKNHRVLYEAYRLATADGTVLPPVVVVGQRGWLVEETLTLLTRDPRLRAHVLFAEEASDAELTWLYRNCLFTLYPSLAEGWGLPVRESLSFGKVCVTSETPTIREIAGGLAVHVPPLDPRALLTEVRRLLSPQHRAAAERRIREGFAFRAYEDVVGDLLAAVAAQ